MGDLPRPHCLPLEISQVCNIVHGFLAENPKSCRAFLKSLHLERPLQDYTYHTLSKKTDAATRESYIRLLEDGQSLGVISEAGCPGIADPGAEMVALAHQNNITVYPLVGPSSILMGLMSSGLSGQQFTFHGYLPIDKSEMQEKLKVCVSEAQRGYSQIVMDTPYRNLRLFEVLLLFLPKNMKLCIAADITQKGQWIQTHTVAQWKKLPEPKIHKVPAIFSFGY